MMMNVTRSFTNRVVLLYCVSTILMLTSTSVHARNNTGIVV